MHVNAYLIFDGKCEEALEFYKRTIGAKVNALMRFGEAPDQSQIKPESKRQGDAFRLPDRRDGNPGVRRLLPGRAAFQGFSLTITAANDAEALRLFTASPTAARSRCRLEKTFFAASFGIAMDKFGVNWMVIADKE